MLALLESREWLAEFHTFVFNAVVTGQVVVER
jgi:hypothetical protein